MRLLFEIDTKDYDKNGKSFVRPSDRTMYNGPKDQLMLEREAKILEMLIKEGYFA